MLTAREIATNLGSPMQASGGWMCSCPVATHGRGNGDRSPSLLIKEKDGRLKVHCFAGCSREDIINELRSRGLWGHGAHARPADVSQTQSVQQTEYANIRTRIEWAKKTWNQTDRARGSLVETYLRSRGITIPPPHSIRFHPSLRHGPTKTYWPAMVATIRDWRGDFCGVHRTYLTRDGSGKAPVSPSKMTLGSVRGAAVHLGPAEPKIVVVEGIETALSVMQESGISTWSAVSAGNMHEMKFPDDVEHVVFAADGDNVGRSSAMRAALLVKRSGRTASVFLNLPDGKDFNDILRGSLQR